MTLIEKKKSPDRTGLNESHLVWNEKMALRHGKSYWEEMNFLTRFIEEKRIAAILENVGESPLLEIGSGCGMVLARLLEKTHLAVGIDLSFSSLQCAKSVLRPASPPLIQAYAEKLPFKDNVFKTVVATEVIEHVRDPRALLREMERVMAPGGTAIVTAPNERLINILKSALNAAGLFRLMFRKMPYRMDREWHLTAFDLSLLTSLFEERFEIWRVYSLPFPFLPLRFVVAGMKKRPSRKFIS